MAVPRHARLSDLGAVVGALLAGRFFFQLPLGWLPALAAVAAWALGLSATGNYRAAPASGAFEAVGRLLVDHGIIAAVWAGGLYFSGHFPGAMPALGFTSLAFVGLIAVRLLDGRLATQDGEHLAPSRLFADLMLALLGFAVATGFWSDLRLAAPMVFVFLLGRVVALALFERWAAGQAGGTRQAAFWLAAQALGALPLVGAAAVFGWARQPLLLLVSAGLGPLLLTGAYRRARHRWPRTLADPPEEWRRAALLAAGLFLIHPYFSRQLIGTFDAKLYAEAMQDFLGQVRSGVWPVLVSQTDIAPFGAVFPFRMASYHFFLGAVIDLFAGRSLNVYAVQHATLVLSALAGLGSMYAVLRSLLPERRNEAAALAFLYVASPAWMAALYSKDMYFTLMALPWLPLLLWASLQTFRGNQLRHHVLLGLSLSAVWLAHPPVGFWATVAAGLIQLLRLVSRRPGRADLVGLGVAAGLCLLLDAGLFVSLADVRISGEYLDPSATILANLRSVLPAVFLPVRTSADNLSDFQLGYALQLLLLAALWRRRPASVRERGALLVVCALLLVLVYPIPGLTRPLWQAMPVAVASITNVWPMQRIYPLLAALAAVIAALALPGISRRVGLPLLLALCLWSAAEAAKFTHRGAQVTKSPEATRVASKIENSPLLPNWTAYTPRLPDLPLVNRVHDPRLLDNLRDPRTREVIRRNQGDGPAAPVAGDGAPWAPGVLRINPGLTLVPGERYELSLEFAPEAVPGVLQLLSLEIDPRFYQEISLTPANLRTRLTVHLWTSETTPVSVALFFRPNDPAWAAAARPRLVHGELRSYRHDGLPIRITSLAPYRATVETVSAALLETHRFFARGYRARVDGRPVEVSESPQHFVEVPVHPGRNEVALDYPGPTAVRVAFWVSGLAWLGAGLGLLRAARRPR